MPGHLLPRPAAPRRVRAASLLLAAFSFTLLVFAFSCAEKPPCEKACARLAACKAAARNGNETVLGEGKEPPDPACLAKCEGQPDTFSACEGKRKDCKALLECSRSFMR
jgi:Cys-rich protein (TIGR04453 family)